MRGRGASRLCPPYGPHYVVSDREPPTRSITLPLSLSLSTSLVIAQAPFFLTASTKTTPAAFGPVAEKLSSAFPDEPLTEIPPNGIPVEMGLPRIFTATGSA